jgi:Outer membrane protein beta-barrel domain
MSLLLPVRAVVAIDGNSRGHDWHRAHIGESVLNVNVLNSKMMKTGCLAFAFGVLLAVPAHARQMTWTDQGFVNVNLGGQTGSHTLATDRSGANGFDIYGERGSLSTTQDIGGGGLFDISGGYKVWKNLAVGMGYSHSGDSADAAISAGVPDPNFTDTLRPLTGTASGLKHSENAIHFTGTWVMPVTDKVDVGFSFGPSIFNVSQEIVTAITVNEPGPTLGTTTVEKQKKTGVGVNLGLDVNYFFTKKIGGGVLLRYAGSSVDIDSATDSLGVGGFQIGVGARFRF